MQKAENRRGGFLNSRGFTLIEVIAVLVLLGILSAVIFFAASDRDTELHPATEALKFHLRYAQTQAMNRNTIAPDNLNRTANPWGIQCDRNRYRLFERDPVLGDVTRILPDIPEGGLDPDGWVSLQDKHARTNAAFTLLFDDRGIPYNGNLAQPLAAALTIRVTDTRTGASRTFRVRRLTGFVEQTVPPEPAP